MDPFTLWPFVLCPRRGSSGSRRTLANAVILLIVLSCSTSADRPESSADHLANCPVNSKSESAKAFERQCPNANFNELLAIYASGANVKRDNSNDLNELVASEEAQVDKRSGCACSRIARRSGESANVSSDKRVMIDQENESRDRRIIPIQMIVANENRLPDKRIDFAADNERMILLRGGEFSKGTNDESAVASDYEKPARFVYVNAFHLDRFEVSNLDFSLFALSAAAPHYRTDAELLNGSFVFDGLLSAERKMKIKNDKLNSRVAQAPWWLQLENASWFRPDADRSLFKLSFEELAARFASEFADELAIQTDSKALFKSYSEWIDRYAESVELLRHPVVHVSFDDALNYCRWLHKRLPTENEWEYACKSEAQRPDQRYPWGDELETGRANLWQGVFPTHNTVEDGFFGTCPVDSLANQTRSGFKHLVSN